MNLSEFTDSEIDALRVAVLVEQERRINLAKIPGEIAVLARMFRDGGGDEATLQDALTPEQVAELNLA